MLHSHRIRAMELQGKQTLISQLLEDKGKIIDEPALEWFERSSYFDINFCHVGRIEMKKN